MVKSTVGVILDSQSMDTRRNERKEMIIRLVKHLMIVFFLILCKRVNQATYLIQRRKEDVTSLIGNNKNMTLLCKAETEFDHPRLDAMIMVVITKIILF